MAECLWGIDKDHYLSTLARKHVALLSGGHPNIYCGDSLSMTDESAEPINDLLIGDFDVLLTNPPFGSKIVSADKKTLLNYQLAKKWKFNSSTGEWEPTNIFRTQVPPQILFVEQCINLVRDGGRIGIVVPESMVSNKTHRYVVQYLMEKTHIKAVVGMPEALFKTSGKGGTHTKTCLIVAEKDESRARGNTKVFMAEAQWCGHDSRARNIPFNDLPKITENLIALRGREDVPHSPLGFLMPENEIKSHILCPHYYDPRIEEDLSTLRETHELISVAELLEEKTLSLRTGDELGKLAYGTGNIPFIRTSDFSNWEIKADAKHGVERGIYEKYSKKQDVRPYDIFMVRDGTYLIGTCAIVTPDDPELLYQSLNYKLRVNPTQRGITPFLLLAVLSSSIVQRQVRAKQFTQDIIDTLGDRIQELVLPIPKGMEERAEITATVEKAIEHRQSARRMTQE
ncbi:MAG: N-6 DNA methylase, partial [Cyclobacteriaceae bacterium]